MPKKIPVIAARGRHTMNDILEVCFTGLDGKEITIALMPSFAHEICRVLEQLQDRPETVAIATLVSGKRKTLKALAEGEPLRSGGYRVSADPRNEEVYLQIAQPDQTVAEIPLNADQASRLIGCLQNALAAVLPAAGSA